MGTFKVGPKIQEGLLLEMLGRHGGMVTMCKSGGYRQLEAAELAELIVSRNMPLPDEVWAAGFDHWKAAS